MIFKDNKVYDIMKWVVTVVLPALATFIITLGQIWNWTAYTVPIGATIVALEAFLAACLCISASNYKKMQALEKEK